ncbi:MAG TPA: beta-ketoacyl-ACP synthase II [Gammaproteobacteria bacterium]|nr:beta-ketoacyl-ACP synthase II [Gammaproteobacteria bacterium]
MKSERRVVVTGMGALTPLGLSVKETWDNLLKGKSGVILIDTFDPSALKTQIGALVRNFHPEQYLSSKDAHKVDRFIQFGFVAAKEAIEDSGLAITEENSPRIGVAIGSGIGGLPLIEKNHSALLQGGPRKISPFFIPGAIINMAAGMVSIKFNLKGPNIAIVTACTTGAHNIGHAARMIAYGDADAMVAGGVEMATTELGVGGFSASRAVSVRNDEPEKASRPWDRDRDGFVLGEGAGILVLEEYEHARRRGAKIYAELTGFGMSGDAYHMTSPGEDGTALAMRNTLQDAGVNTGDIDYINAHATSTHVGDLAEAQAIKKVFGADAYKIPVSSTKSMTGHLLGAAGSVEAIFAILAIRDQIAPATINLDNPDEGCDLDFIPHYARPMKIDLVLSNSFGFGGTNGCLIFKRM